MEEKKFQNLHQFEVVVVVVNKIRKTSMLRIKNYT